MSSGNVKHELDGSVFDYIICGGGTSGCVIAASLAEQTEASILLVEAGRDAGVAPDVLIPGKYLHQLSTDLEGLWQLPTVPQRELNDRELVFLRGKQLGGSSAVNYMALARGPAADYDEWARLVDDDSWKWDKVLPLMKELEDFRPERPLGFEKYAQPESKHHGSGGPLKAGFGEVMTPGVETFINACKEIGIEICLDNNSGYPVGVGLAQFNTGNGVRLYAANAFLDTSKRQQLRHLKILTHTSTNRVIMKGIRAIAVELFDAQSGTELVVRCRREIVLSAGTFGSPQILMLSGVGPRSELGRHEIECVQDLPGVGQKMLDHSILTIEYRVDDSLPAHNQIFANPDLLAAADAQYLKDKTGPHNEYGTSGSVAFPKIPALYSSPEFNALDKATKLFMLEATRPSAEIWLGSGPAAYDREVLPDQSYITHELLLQNNLSRGTVSLRSKSPRDLPVINPSFLEHPYDKRIAIETVRTAVSLSRTEAYGQVIRRMVHGPSSDEDKDILEFVRANLGQGYHSLGTCAMGTSSNSTRVVDADFKVIGVDGLRVADLSVCPILTSNHTQINAYLIGQKCARKLVEAQNVKVEQLIGVRGEVILNLAKLQANVQSLSDQYILHSRSDSEPPEIAKPQQFPPKL